MSDQGSPPAKPYPPPSTPPVAPGSHVPPKPQAAPSPVEKPGGGKWPKGLPMPGVQGHASEPQEGPPLPHPLKPTVGSLPPANVGAFDRSQSGAPATAAGRPSSAKPPPKPGALPRTIPGPGALADMGPNHVAPPKPGSISDVPKKPMWPPKGAAAPPGLTPAMPKMGSGPSGAVPYKPMDVPKSTTTVPPPSGLPLATPHGAPRQQGGSSSTRPPPTQLPLASPGGLPTTAPPPQIIDGAQPRTTSASSSSGPKTMAPPPQIPQARPPAHTSAPNALPEKAARSTDSDFDRLAIPAPPSFLPTLPSLPPPQTAAKRGSEDDDDADYRQYLSSDTDESATGGARKSVDGIATSIDSGAHSQPAPQRSSKREDDTFGSSSSDGENDERRQGQDLALIQSKSRDSKRTLKKKAQEPEPALTREANWGEGDDEREQRKSDVSGSPKVKPKSKGSMLKKLWKGKEDGIPMVDGTPIEPLDQLPADAKEIIESDGVEVTKVGLNGKAYPRKLVFNEATQSVMILGGKHPIHHPCCQITSYVGGATEELTKYGFKTPADRSKAVIFRTGQRCYSFLCSSKETAEILGMTCAVLGNVKKEKKVEVQEYPDGSRYRGEMSSGLRHGSGTLIMSDGATYVAEWANDKREGWGKEVHKDGTSFEGFYTNGQRHGKGSMTWFDSSKYEGDFENGRASGEGKLQRADGSHYEGQFYNDCMQGEGLMKWPDGVKYQGQFIRNQRDGNGRMEWAGGKWRSYTGQWRSGMQHGEGTLVSHDALSYLGVFYEGKLERWLE